MGVGVYWTLGFDGGCTYISPMFLGNIGKHNQTVLGTVGYLQRKKEKKILASIVSRNRLVVENKMFFFLRNVP